MKNNVRIRRFDKNLPLPEYKTSGAAGFDLCARVETVIAPRSIGYVPLNVALHPPEGYFVLLAARSSLHKRGLMSANGIGIIDRDYSGNDDEYTAVLYNFTETPVVIASGDRIMQGVFVPHVRADWEEVDDLGNGNRGGFGTTGKN
jgi:dUTP pyrophosphatase